MAGLTSWLKPRPTSLPYFSAKCKAELIMLAPCHGWSRDPQTFVCCHTGSTVSLGYGKLQASASCRLVSCVLLRLSLLHRQGLRSRHRNLAALAEYIRVRIPKAFEP